MNPPDLEMRRAIADELGAVLSCVCAAFQSAIQPLARLPGPMLLDYPGLIRTGWVWVALDGSDIVGVLVQYPTEEGFYLDALAVNPLHQRRGIGTGLLHMAEQEALRHSCASLYLCDHGVAAQHPGFFPRHGFERIDGPREAGDQRVFFRRVLAGEV